MKKWLTLQEVLDLPYGTKLERCESDWIYEMRNELVIINEDRESGVDYPSIDKELYTARFKLLSIRGMDRLQYLKNRYDADDIEILKCRVPFDFEDKKYDILPDMRYIDFINTIEEREDREVYIAIKDRI